MLSFIGNDIETEGVYVFEDGIEMSWLGNFCCMGGPSEDGLAFSTYESVSSCCPASGGAWSNTPITSSFSYICEKND